MLASHSWQEWQNGNILCKHSETTSFNFYSEYEVNDLKLKCALFVEEI